MPELPEVETFRRSLMDGDNGAPSVLEKVVLSAEVLWEGVLVTPAVREFHPRLKGQTVLDITRRGKHLLLHLTQDTLILHPRMSGEVIVESQEEPIRKHYRLILNFENGNRFAFNNIRKFGRAWLTSNPEQILSHLGPEPLSPDFSSQQLYELLHSHNRQMKYFLLDQRMIAGLGNIYTDEALFLAKIHPQTKSDALSFVQAERLWDSIRKVLQEGIKNQGASIDWVYKGGDYQKYLHVYKREGEPCQRCGTPIQKMTIAQRGTHFCPSCQPAPDDEGG